MQFGHASTNVIEKICRSAKETWDHAVLGNIVDSCSRKRSSGPGANPIINRKIIEFLGQTVVADIFFPESTSPQRFPVLIMLCDFPKFVMARFIASVHPIRCVDFLLSFWTPLFGYPQNILCDKTTSFQGERWQAVCHISNIRIILAPARAAFQIGLAERYAGLIKQGYEAISRADAEGFSRNQRLSISRISKNLTPLHCVEIPPIVLVTGRNDLASNLQIISEPKQENPEEITFSKILSTAYLLE